MFTRYVAYLNTVISIVILLLPLRPSRWYSSLFLFLSLSVFVFILPPDMNKEKNLSPSQGLNLGLPITSQMLLPLRHQDS